MATEFTICVVCTGNICRSPIGEAVVRQQLAVAGFADRVRVCSSGTGAWHLGEGPDHRAQAVARRNGLDISGHRVQQFTAEQFEDVDLILALDGGHLRDLKELAPDAASRSKVVLLRSFDAASVDQDDLDVADPYYGDKRDFEITYEQVLAAAPGIVDYVREHLDAGAAR